MSDGQAGKPDDEDPADPVATTFEAQLLEMVKSAQKTITGPDGKGEPSDAQIEQFKAAVASGVVSRGSVYQQCVRAIEKDEEEKAKYAKCATRDAKAQFRLDWANKKLVKMTAKYSQKRSLTSSEWKSGKWLTFKRIADKEKCNKTALNICKSCIKKGEGYYKYDEDRGTVVFRYLTEGDSERLDNSWWTEQELQMTAAGSSSQGSSFIPNACVQHGPGPKVPHQVRCQRPATDAQTQLPDPAPKVEDENAPKPAGDPNDGDQPKKPKDGEDGQPEKPKTGEDAGSKKPRVARMTSPKHP